MSCSDRILIATCRPESESHASSTTPIPPAPSRRITRKPPITSGVGPFVAIGFGWRGWVGTVSVEGGVRSARDSDCPQYAQNDGGSPDTFSSRWQCGQVINIAALFGDAAHWHYRRAARKRNQPSLTLSPEIV